MTYRRLPAPKDYEPGWLDQELEKLEQQLLGADNFRLKEWHTVPPKPRLGDVYLADGVDWDPGSGPGAYLFDGSGFVLLGFDGTLAAGSVGTTELANDSVTFAKMQNIATQRALGRNTAGSGDPEEVTILQMLNWIASSARGDILRRGASDWERLAIGSDGQLLTSDGTDPSWVTPAGAGVELLDSDTISSQATLDVVLSGFTSYRKLKLLANLIPATDDVELWLRFSTDGGNNFDASGYSYTTAWSADDNAANFGNILSASAAQLLVAGHPTAAYSVSNTASEGGVDVEIDFYGLTTARFGRAMWKCGYYTANGVGAVNNGSGLREAAQDTDAFRLLFQSGNIASGDWALYGFA